MMASERSEPRVLFVAVQNWIAAERLPADLHRHGCRVAVLCPRHFFLALTRHVDAIFGLPRWFDGLLLLPRLEYVIRVWRPSRVLPVDEHVVRFLHDVRAHRGMGALASRRLRDLIEISLGDPAHYPELSSRARLAALVERLGIRAPAARSPATPGEVRRLVAEVGFPVVLKREGTVAGHGILIIHNESELAACLLHPPPSRATRYGRRLVGALAGLVRAGRYTPANGAPGGIQVQQWIDGTPAMYLVVADRGAMLAGVGFLKERTNPPGTGPSTVVRHVRNAEMAGAARAIVAATRVSGLISLDFMVEQETGRAYVIELNPRPSVVTPAGRHVGVDLTAAYLANLEGRSWDAVPGPVVHPLIAHYPKELARDPESPYLRTAYHDVPEDDPALILAYERWIARQHRRAGRPVGQPIARTPAAATPRPPVVVPPGVVPIATATSMLAGAAVVPAPS
jgi:hypothetical protein